MIAFRLRVLRVRPFMRSSSTAPPKQLTLPRLPVPELRKTLDRYLRSIEPFLLEDESRGGISLQSAYALRAKWADEFADGVGRLCQERLLALDRASPNNWLDDNFWTNKAYLEWRAPLLINSNWWLAFLDDDRIPAHAKEEQDDITPWQIRRGAWLVHRVLQFKNLLDRTAKLFNIARIPKPKCDILSKPVSAANPDAQKFYVMIHGWCYAITAYHSTSTRQLLNVQDLETRIRAANLQHLLALSPQNQRTHRIICQSLLGLSLDSPARPAPLSGQTAFASHLHAIRSTNSNVANRIFDKPCTFIVDPSTRAGASGEHSPCDALVPSIVAEWAIVEGIDAASFDTIEPVSLPSALPHEQTEGWERLDWDVDDNITAECTNAVERAKTIIDNSDADVYWFEDYGTDWIKTTINHSPDAYIQMVLQLAYVKTRGQFTATYETALTRMFKRGRTETIRTFTKESRAWVLGMADPKLSPQARRNLLHDALHVHSTLTREAATGRGIDRHLLGLKLMLRPLSGEYSPFLDDELFQRSQTWKLSTSGLSAGHLFRGTGFGAMYEDGYGINYLAAPDMIKFGVESKFSSPHTSSKRLKDAVFESLREMRALCLTTDSHTVHSIPDTVLSSRL
ncbi:Choline/Carnitine o-acyltransferase-domain-containing protein [Mycena amicta]|nr:Choline/Carnitine o-acyltransferase-domain-containing protein [Mycena amicta]